MNDYEWLWDGGASTLRIVTPMGVTQYERRDFRAITWGQWNLNSVS